MRLALLLGVFILGASSSARDLFADEEDLGDAEVSTRSIMVTATRAEEDIFEIPMTVNVITSEDIEREPYVNIIDILANTPGLEIDEPNREGAGTSRIGIRGEDSKRTLILVDGVRIQAGKGHMTGSSAGMPFITSDQIERIEIIKGPASVLYGPEAIGGVINIILKKGGSDKPVSFSPRIVYDSAIKAANVSAAIFGKYKGVTYRVAGNGVNAKDRKTGAGGVVSDSTYKNRYYYGQIGYDWKDYSLNLQLDKFQNSSRTGSTRWFPTNDRQSATVNLAARNLTKNLTRLSFLTSFQDMDMVTIWNIQGTTEKNNHKVIQTTLQSDWNLGGHFIVAGLDFVKDTIEKISDAKLATEKSGRVEGEMLTTGLFAQDEWSIRDDLRLTMGVRNSWVSGKTVGADGLWNPIVALPRNNQRSDSKLVANVGLVYTGFEGIALRALWSQGYTYPSITQLFTGYSGRGNSSDVNTFPNPNLEPETSNSYEVGIRILKGGWNVDWAFYYTRAKNFISEDGTCEAIGLVCTELGDGTWINHDGANTFGSELQVAYTFQDYRLTPYANVTYLRRELIQEGQEKTTKSGKPPYRGRIGFRWEADLNETNTFFSDIYSTWAVKCESAGSGRSATGIVPRWMIGNLSLGIKGGQDHKYDVSLNIRNLFDRAYTTKASSLNAYGLQVVLGMGYQW